MKRICKKVFPMLLFLWIISEAVSVSGDQKDRKDHTVMIYMIGSNLESRNGSGSKDILEMSTSGIDLSKSNVVICTGGSRRWALDISARQNSVLELTGDENYFQTVLESDENQNMGDGKTLTDFLDYAALTYPAEHYSLIFWDHGSGPVMGFGNDELYEYDSLRLPELKEGLENSIFGDICHLDWIGFDACLMSGIEVAEILADYADYMVASQEVEPGSGWDYSFLEILNETSNPIQIA
ncbi:MAG: hypothetical protein IJW67_13010, partial [Blautia sp.]|nr:hypothetical protein [Blautia sp.]